MSGASGLYANGTSNRDGTHKCRYEDFFHTFYFPKMSYMRNNYSNIHFFMMSVISDTDFLISAPP